MFKAFLHPHFGTSSSLFIDINPKFEIVPNSDQAEIIFIHSNVDPAQLQLIVKPHHVLVCMDIFHIDHGMDLEWLNYNIQKLLSFNLTKKIVAVHTIMNLNDTHNTIYYDHLFDRQKLYHTDYNRGTNLNSRVWTYGCNEEVYKLNSIDKKPLKKFMAPMKIYSVDPTDQKFIHPRMQYRRKLKNFLVNTNDSFVSDKHSPFLPNGATNKILVTFDNTGSWFPAADAYYNSSLISVYTETLVLTTNTRSVTEKTFDPLIKGNFILPFGYYGLIKDILNYGFKLPKWIDYSYDNIVDDNDRFDAYMKILIELNSKFSLEKLFELTMHDQKMLQHNRSVFYSRPYSYPLLADKIKLCIDHNDSNDWKY